MYSKKYIKKLGYEYICKLIEDYAYEHGTTKSKYYNFLIRLRNRFIRKANKTSLLIERRRHI